MVKIKCSGAIIQMCRDISKKNSKTVFREFAKIHSKMSEKTNDQFPKQFHQMKNLANAGIKVVAQFTNDLILKPIQLNKGKCKIVFHNNR